MDEFVFRLSKGKPEDFWRSVQTAEVKERISSEKHGSYDISFYQNANCFCVGVSHPILLPDNKTLDVLCFEFVSLADGLRVIIHYSDFPTYRPYLVGLLREIAKDWKEAKQELDRLITKLLSENRTYLTFSELEVLENTAIAGDENAQRILDSMAREEGYDSWESLNVELLKESAPLLEKWKKAVAKERKRRESIPGVLQVWSYLKKMYESGNPLYQAIAGNVVYHDIYKMAKSFQEKSLNAPLFDLNDSIQRVAINTTSVIAGSGYDDLPIKELKHRAARFDAMRYGDIDTPAAQSVGAAKPEYIFDMSDEVVNIRYGIEKDSFRSSKGFAYLRHLLINKNQDIEAKQLVIGFTASENTIIYDDVDELHEAGDPQELTDKREIEDCEKRQDEIKKELGELKDEIEDFGDGKDGERAIKKQALEDEWVKLEQYKKEVIGLGGKKRAFPSEDERARVSVRKAIKECLNKIEESMPNFAKHLQSPNLTTGKICRYSPSDSIEWASK